MRRWEVSLVVGCAAAALTACSVSSTSTSTANDTGGGGSTNTADVLTYHNDTMRTGQNLSETALTSANVNATSFGKLRMLAADGSVDAAPLVVSGLSIAGATHNVVFVASEHDSVYAYDADSGALLKQVSLLGNGEAPSDDRGCPQVSPEIGITSTPVIDRSAGPNGTLFVVAMSKDGNGNYHQRLHALDLLTLQDRLSPMLVQAQAPGSSPNGVNGQLSFDPGKYKERGALLLVQGQIYTVWASHCDGAPYNGWIMAYNESTLAQTRVLNLTPNGLDGAIWDVAGLAADTSGVVYASVANGSFDTTLDSNGQPSQQNYGNSALRISGSGSGSGSGSLSIADYFTPWNTVALSDQDVDFGSGSAMLLPDQTDSSGNTRHLLLVGGKDGSVFLLDRDHLGGFNPNQNQVYQQLTLAGGVWSAPAYFNGSVYVGDAGDSLQAYALSQAQLPQTPSSQTSIHFAYPGAFPAVSANGTNDGIVWALESTPDDPAVLHAYNPGNLAQEYYNSGQAANDRDGFGNGNKFITPVITDGKVFVGTPNGVAVFGLLQ